MVTQADCFVAVGLGADVTSLTVPASSAIYTRTIHPLISNACALPLTENRNYILEIKNKYSKLTFDTEIPKHTRSVLIPLKKKKKGTSSLLTVSMQLFE